MTDVVARSEVKTWYAAAMADLDAVVAAADRLGPAAGRYANELFTEDRGEVMVFYPVDHHLTIGSGGRVEVVTLPPVDLAVAVHHGSHEDINETYGRLGRWAVEHALAVGGLVHETYAVGPRDTSVESEWRTEIGWPVFRVSRDEDE